MDGDSQTEQVLERALRRALDSRAPQLERLSYANTSVRLTLPEVDAAVTLKLDRHPPEVALGGEPAEIEIELTTDQAAQMASGRLMLPTEVVRGTVPTHGPVRRFLEVEPILRGLLDDGEWDELSTVDAAPIDAGSIAPDLLAIETRSLHKSFGRNHILRGANIRIPEGVISVVLGPSGTGKSVLLQHIVGLMRADSGEVLVRGRALSGMSRSQILALRTEIGVMFQDGALFSAMDVYDNVAFPLRQHTDLNEREVHKAVMGRLEAVGLVGSAHAMPASLSGGMRKRAGLARALVLEPSIVLCDEPDSGLDPVRTALLADLLREQHRETGGTMIVITHNIAMTRRIAEHISVVWQGEVLASGMRADIMNSDDPFLRQFLAGNAEGPLGMDA